MKGRNKVSEQRNKRAINEDAAPRCEFMHIHDELVIEADPKVSLDAICEQMGRTPPWAKGLLLRADGYTTPFYKKD